MKNFEPIIRIMEDGQSLLVMFDSAWEGDTTRMPRLVRVQLPVHDLSWKMEREESAADTYSYAISLVIKSPNAEASYPLGDITPEKNAPIVLLDTAIRQEFAGAFARALLVYLSQKSQPTVPFMEINHEADLPPRRTEPHGFIPEHNARRVQSRPMWKSVARAGVFAVVIAGAIGFLFSLIPSMGNFNAADPIQTAVAQNMAQDPASITAQVELTKETLRQMGLDPGAAGDLGCLAPR